MGPEGPVDHGRRFWAWLGLIALAAVALRAIYIVAFAPLPARTLDDTFWYAFVSDEIYLGHGFSFLAGHGAALSSGFHIGPTAQHPPLYPLALAGLRWLGVSTDNLRWFGVVTGAMTVIGLGALGRSLAGARTGLVAAAIAAVYPLLIVPDGALLSETLYGPVLVLVLWAGVSLARQPDVKRAAMLGAGIGVATLVRSEALALVVVLALPLAWRGGGGRSRALRLLAAVGCALVVVAPWVVRNDIALGAPTLSTNDGVTLAWANCAQTYHGARLGYFDPACANHPLAGNEVHQSAVLRRQALRYASDHIGRLPVVILARLARTWGLFDPFQGSNSEGRNPHVSDVGVVMYYPLALLAIFGAAAWWRRRPEFWVLMAPIVLVTLTAAVTFGSLRLRYLAELPLVLLASLGIQALSRRRWRVVSPGRRGWRREIRASAG
jgi:hypothetical protein